MALAVVNCLRSAGRTYYGQPDGKVGMKVVQLWLWEPETPPSPDEKKTDVPRAPS